MVKRIVTLFSDGSMNVHSNKRGEVHALNEAREEVKRWNKGETNPEEMAQCGEIEIDYNTFKERV